MQNKKYQDTFTDINFGSQHILKKFGDVNFHVELLLTIWRPKKRNNSFNVAMVSY